MIIGIASSEYSSDVICVLLKTADSRESPGRVIRRVEPPEPLANLTLFLLKLLQGRTGLQGFLPDLPQEGLLVALQGREAVRMKQLSFQDADNLRLKAVVPHPLLAGGTLPVPPDGDA